MSSRKILLIAFLFVNYFFGYSQNSYKNDTIRALDFIEIRGEVYFSFRADYSQIEKMGRFLEIDSYVAGEVFAYSSARGFNQFLKTGIEFTVYDPPGSWFLGEVKSDFTLNYPKFSEYLTMMQGWAEDYPELCDYYVAGESVEGREIVFLRISGNNNQHKSKPRFMYSSTIHGDETTGYYLMLRLIDYLLTGYNSDNRITAMLDSLEIWINPLANPDGTYFGGDGNSVVAPKRMNSNNVDLNRDFPELFKSSYSYEGRQPETVAMMQLMESKQFIMSANFHGGAQLLNYPWDSYHVNHADDAWFYYICREFADSTDNRYLNDFGGVIKGIDWYLITGGRQDYVNYYTGSREVTIEISRDKAPPANQLEGYWSSTQRSILNFIEQAIFGIRGKVIDKVTGEPVYARLAVIGHDLNRSDIYSDPETGRFYRLINEGTYNLMFIAEGYESKIVSGVDVQNRMSVWLEVELTPEPLSAQSVDQADNFNIKVFPIPASGFFTTEIFADTGGIITIDLYDVNGRLIKRCYNGYHTPGLAKIVCPVHDIPSGIYYVVIGFGGKFEIKKVVISGN